MFGRRHSLGGSSAAAALLAMPQIESDDEDRYRPIQWPLVRRLLSWLYPYRKMYFTAIGLGLVHVLLEMQSPQFVKAIINYGAALQAQSLVGVTMPMAVRHILWIVLLWALVFTGSVILQRYTILIMTRAGESVQFTFRRALFEHLQKLSMSYYDKTKLGRIISRCTSDVNSLREVNVWGIWQIVANGTMMAVAAAMMIYTDWRLFLSVCWLGPVLLFCSRKYQSKAAGMYQVVREGFTRVSTNLAENITGVRAGVHQPAPVPLGGLAGAGAADR